METILFIYFLGYLITGVAIRSMKVSQEDKVWTWVMCWFVGLVCWWIFAGLMIGWVMDTLDTIHKEIK